MSSNLNINVRVQLPNGNVINVTDPTILKMFSRYVEDGNHYFSETQGWIPIEDMETNHLKNAILKRLTKQLESLRGASTEEVQEYFNNTDITNYSMISEFLTR